MSACGITFSLCFVCNRCCCCWCYCFCCYLYANIPCVWISWFEYKIRSVVSVYDMENSRFSFLFMIEYIFACFQFVGNLQSCLFFYENIWSFYFWFILIWKLCFDCFFHINFFDSWKLNILVSEFFFFIFMKAFKSVLFACIIYIYKYTLKSIWVWIDFNFS